MYFDGFDIQIRLNADTGLNAGGFDDGSTDWFADTFAWQQYSEGYLHGRSMRPVGIVGPSGPNMFRRQAGYWGFWIRLESQGSGTGTTILTTSVPDTEVQIVCRVDLNNALLIRLPDGTEIPTAGALTEEWAYIEFHVNFNAGSGFFRFNGIETGFSFTPAWVSDQYNIGTRLRGGYPGPAIDWTNKAHTFLVDHYWHDSEPPPRNGVAAVAIQTSQDRFGGVNGFRGSLIINGRQYQTPGRRALASANNNPDGMNLCNTINYYFPNYPVDGSPWSLEKLNTVDSWGVCFARLSFNPNDTHEVRLEAMCFSVLRFENGRSYVDYITPSGVTYFSGPWRKTDPNKTYAAHVNTVPRPNVPTRRDTESLYIGDDGCILFRNTYGEDTPELMEEVGITFAEEYREDYRDWVKVDGGTSFKSFVDSGYTVYGDGNKNFQNNYLTINYENVPNGGAYVQGIWGYSIDKDTGRWSMRQKVYANSKPGYKHQSRKLKIRGNGKALQIRVENEGDKPFVINGWSKLITSDQDV